MKSSHIGEYRVVSALGPGRLTDVYLVPRPQEPSELGVLKHVRADVLSSIQPRDSDGARLAEDAELATRLHHPGIARTYDVSASGDRPFWVSEYIDGQPFDRVLAAARSSGGIAVDIALQVVSDVLHALDYAHNRTSENGTPLGIIHRDIRPHNIFVSYQGDVKLVDFCVAPKVHKRNDESHAQAVEDRTYTPPEGVQNGDADRRADVFAVGMLMWDCLAIDHPPASSGSSSADDEILYEAVAMRADLDPRVAAISDRALEPDHDKGYPTAAAMLADLEKLGVIGPDRSALGGLVRRLFPFDLDDRARHLQLLASGDAADSDTATESPDARPLSLSIVPPALPQLRRPSDGLQGGTWPGAVALMQAESRPSDRPPGTLPPGVIGLPQPAALPSDRPPPRLPPQRRESPPPPPAELEYDAHGKSRPVAGLVVAALMAGLIAIASIWTRSDSTPAQPPSEATTAAVPAPASADAEIVLRLCGSNTIGAELAPELIESLLTSKGAADVTRRRTDAAAELTTIVGSFGNKRVGAEISARGSATAFTGLADGTCDVGMASRAIDDAEVAKLRERGLGDMRAPGAEHVIGLDGVAVIVHANNPLGAIDRKALHDVFSGAISDWSAFGGQGPITVLARDHESGTFDLFQRTILGKDQLVSSAKRFAQSDLLADAVAVDPLAIGIVGLAYVRSAKALAVGEAGAAPMLPTSFTVATQEYLLSRRLYFYTPPSPRTPWVMDLLHHTQSRRGQEVSVKNQFVDLGLLSYEEPCDARCSPGYAATIAKAQRVSLDFRFQTGSNQPDLRAQRDVGRLVEYLREQRSARVILLGFSDALGSATANAQLSFDRAGVLAHELSKRGVYPAVVKGFGSQMPVASNDTESGRERNRRVEVWLER